jgi:hypothetical protein
MQPEDTRFNLYKTVDTKNKKTGAITPKESVIGYGMEFETCIDRIAKDILSSKNEVVSFDGFIKAYQKVVGDIKGTLKNQR